MATSESQNSSSSSEFKGRYDIFLSFRGLDTRKKFTDHLYHALKLEGFQTFRDHDEINRGDVIKPELQKAIANSRTSVIVLSKNYANSTACLLEVETILKQCKKSDHFVLPVFYEVDPGEIKEQAKNLDFGKKRKRVPVEQVKGWSAALKVVASMAGMVSQNQSNGNMVVRVPFRRWLHVKHRNPETPHGGFYCLLPIQGRRVIAAVARYPRPGELQYKAYSIFVREYGEMLGLGENLIWAAREDLVKWLDALVHNSYIRHSTPGVERCWYIKHMSQLYAFAPTMLLPEGLRASFEGIGRTTWILIRHGSKAWPIQVVDGVMQNGWHEFRTSHGIGINYKLILACERRWVFNAIILDQNNAEVSYDWTMLLNEHWRQFHSHLGNFVTACIPSTMQHNLPLIKSGYWCIPQTNYLWEFETKLQPVLEDLNLATISIRMGNRTWSISVDDAHLNAAMFNLFLDVLHLELYDYVFITMLSNLEVRVVILDAANDRERIYEWF